ncbi:MAG TPA: M1 family metallopeptidase [Balneolales bacterium]|nr:M1 family metallopeptidase [Balneolales bacterium]
MKSLFVSLCLITLSCPVLAQNRPPAHHAPNRTFDLLNLKLKLHFDMSKKAVSGEATETLLPLRMQMDSLSLNAVGMKINRVSLNDKQLGFTYNDTTLTIELGHPYSLDDTLSLVIDYYTQPVKGLTFIEPDSAYPDRHPEVWSQSEAEDARYWYPCHDYPDDFATSEMIVTVPDTWTVISNGALKNVSPDKTTGEKTFDWVEAHPHVIYLNSVIAGIFNRYEDHYGNIPIYYYSDPKYGDLIRKNFSREPDVLRFYSKVTGQPYVWEKLALTTTTDFIWGGEENVSAITLTDNTIHDQYAEPQVSSTSLIAHESAHQWFGDLLTCRSWADAWLNEGFATYFEAMYQEHAFGEDEFSYEMYLNHRRTIVADNRERIPTVRDRYHDPIDMFGTYIYPRGASVLHMLRGILGDSLFFKAIRHYVAENKYQNVDTHDFADAVREATGYNLYWFFNEWLYKAGHPKFEVSHQYDSTKHLLTVRVRQFQKVDSLTPVYRMPVDIYIQTIHDTLWKKVWVDSLKNTFIFSVPGKPKMVNFDENHWLLAEVYPHKSLDELKWQLKHDPDVAGRIQAINSLVFNGDSAAGALTNALENDKYWAVRSKAAEALGNFQGDDIKKALEKAVRDDADARVQESAVHALGFFTGHDVSRLLADTYRNDKNYFVRAAVVTSIAKVEGRKAMSVINEAMKATSYANVIRQAALRSLVIVNPSKGWEAARQWLTYGRPQDIRVEAVHLLVNSGVNKKETHSLLLSYLNDPYIWVRNAAIQELGHVGTTADIPILKKQMKEEPDGRLRELARESIANIQQKESQ